MGEGRECVKGGEVEAQKNESRCPSLPLILIHGFRCLKIILQLAFKPTTSDRPSPRKSAKKNGLEKQSTKPSSINRPPSLLPSLHVPPPSNHSSLHVHDLQPSSLVLLLSRQSSRSLLTVVPSSADEIDRPLVGVGGREVRDGRGEERSERDVWETKGKEVRVGSRRENKRRGDGKTN